MKFKAFIEKYFLKKRFIINYQIQSKIISENISFFSMTDTWDTIVKENDDQELNKFLKLRDKKQSWTFFYYHENKEILGYGFLHVPKNSEWNDSLPTDKSEARVSSLYVYPAHRGKGIIREINQAQINYAEEKGLKLWSVIEARNHASLNAARKNEKSRTTNYLVKLWGRNILSIVKNPCKIYVLLGRRRARR